MSLDPKCALEALSRLADAEIDLTHTALTLAAADRPGLSLERYVNHLKKLAQDVAERHVALLEEGAEDTAQTQLDVLEHVLVGLHSYAGDEEDPDNIENDSLVRVIDRGKGSPLALCILCLHAAKAQGWDVAGLNIPGYFACRLQKDGQRVIFDPFQQCRLLQAQDIRELVKKALGVHAELSSDYYEPVPNRRILILLQNKIKLRQIELEDYEAALRTVETMRLIDPEEFRLFLDAGILYARAGQPDAAMEALEEYIKKAPDERDRHDAALLLQQIKESAD